LIPIPDTDFEPTEVAVSWQVLTVQGHTVVFSTESGMQAVADDIMLTGRGLDFWSKVPGLGRAIFVGRFLRANRDARTAYGRMLASPEYRQPAAWGRYGSGGCGRVVASRRAPCAGDARLYRE
ncbi:MAG: hypothetical protein QOD36_2453, partial [Mycobacterium sp.]|nr:hypothetical protein [Mycobacterium sp.]